MLPPPWGKHSLFFVLGWPISHLSLEVILGMSMQLPDQQSGNLLFEETPLSSGMLLVNEVQLRRTLINYVLMTKEPRIDDNYLQGIDLWDTFLHLLEKTGQCSWHMTAGTIPSQETTEKESNDWSQLIFWEYDWRQWIETGCLHWGSVSLTSDCRCSVILGCDMTIVTINIIVFYSPHSWLHVKYSTKIQNMLISNHLTEVYIP